MMQTQRTAMEMLALTGATFVLGFACCAAAAQPPSIAAASPDPCSVVEPNTPPRVASAAMLVVAASRWRFESPQQVESLARSGRIAVLASGEGARCSCKGQTIPPRGVVSGYEESVATIREMTWLELHTLGLGPPFVGIKDYLFMVERLPFDAPRLPLQGAVLAPDFDKSSDGFFKKKGRVLASNGVRQEMLTSDSASRPVEGRTIWVLRYWPPLKGLFDDGERAMLSPVTLDATPRDLVAECSRRHFRGDARPCEGATFSVCFGPGVAVNYFNDRR